MHAPRAESMVRRKGTGWQGERADGAEADGASSGLQWRGAMQPRPLPQPRAAAKAGTAAPRALAATAAATASRSQEWQALKYRLTERL